MFSKTFLLYQLQHFFKCKIWGSHGIDNILERSEYPIESSIATYCSQPIELVRNIPCDKSILKFFFDVHIYSS